MSEDQKPRSPTKWIEIAITYATVSKARMIGNAGFLAGGGILNKEDKLVSVMKMPIVPTNGTTVSACS